MEKDDSDSRNTPPLTSGLAAKTSLTLLEGLRANEPAAWALMVRLYTPLVHYWCGTFGLRGPDTEDVAQDVFQAAATSLASFRRDSDTDTFRGWLRGITRHKVLLHFRRQGRYPRATGGAAAWAELQEVAAPAEAQDTQERDTLHWQALELVKAEFGVRTWQMFWRTAIEGRSPADLADELGVTPAAVRMAKYRVLRRLKQNFGELID
jgi:RNA polymerase sigma-70 factor (ECF subfamily)